MSVSGSPTSKSVNLSSVGRPALDIDIDGGEGPRERGGPRASSDREAPAARVLLASTAAFLSGVGERQSARHQHQPRGRPICVRLTVVWPPRGSRLVVLCEVVRRGARLSAHEGLGARRGARQPRVSAVRACASAIIACARLLSAER